MTTNLTIEPRQSVLDGLQLYELIDLTLLDKLINSKLLKETFNNKICSNIFKNEKEQLLKYKALFKKGNHGVVKYKRSRGNPYGRSNPEHGLGLHNLRREIRQTLTKGRFKDIDIKNCHPTILLQLINRTGAYNCNYLKSYVENRQDWYNLITGAYKCTEEQAKTLMIIYTYGGGFDRWVYKEKLDASFTEIQDLTRFKSEVRELHRIITLNNPHLQKVARKIKNESGLMDTTNIEGTVCAYFLQEYEVRILETLYTYCIENGIIKNLVAVLCADGIMIEAENYDESLLTVFNEIIKEKIGLDLVFVEKPMMQDYLDIIDMNVIPEPLPPAVAEVHIDYTEILPRDFMPLFSGTTGLDENLKKTYAPNNVGDVAIATVVAKKYGSNFVCASIKNNVWYEFKNHKWNYCDSGHSLKTIISTDFFKYIEGVIILIRKKYPNLVGEDDNGGKLKILYNQLIQVRERMSKSCELKNIMTEIKGMLYQEKFIERLDTNPYILCCSNGVIDLKNKIFRDGTPEDMCSLSTNTPYLTRDEVNQEYSDEATGLADFFDKLMPFESTRKYLLEHTAGSLIGINSSQTFNNFIGVGANGKSTFISLIEKTIGDYFTTIPSTLVTQKRPNIGGASPEIAGLKGVRYAIIQEPSKGETINEGIMKQLTGETSNKGLTGRFLFQDCISFMPMFSLGVCTNIKYNVKSNDSGTWRRIRLIEFNSVFAHETDEEYDEHNPLCFKKDVNLKMDRLAIPFLSFLVNCVFETQGRITECELITTATKEYRFQQDRVGRFIRDVVVPCNGAKTNKKLISEVCNTWFETNYKYRINNNQLFEELDKKYECLRGSYHGFNIITDNHNENAETKEHAFLKMFNRYFSITDDKTDFIKSVEICEWAKLNNLKVNASKTINIILLNEFNLDSKNKEHYKTKKIDGKPVWCWFGVKKNDAVKDVCDADETTADDGDDSNADTDVEIYEEE